MPEPTHQLLVRYRESGLLVDSNLLLLFFVGAFDRTQIRQFKRTREYTEEDFDILSSVLVFFKRIITTPNILTEVSNFLGQLSGSLRYSAFRSFGEKIRLQIIDESYAPSKEMTLHSHFELFGLTDIGITVTAKGKYLVLTNDHDLAQFLIMQGVDVLTLTILREIAHQKT